MRLWFREGLGVLAVILWKQTNLGNQSHCLERVKVPFHLVYQPWVVSLKEFVLYCKCSLGSSVYTSLLCYSYCLPYNFFYSFKDPISSQLALFDRKLYRNCVKMTNNAFISTIESYVP